MFYDSGREVLLARGLVDHDGGRHRVAFLRPLSGRDEALLASTRFKQRGVLSQLLLACVERIGDYEELSLEHVSALTRGDRQRLTLAIRADLFGDRLSLVLTCANPTCRERADMDLEISQLALAADQAAPELLTVQTPDGAVTLREPLGADDEALPEGLADRKASAARLWSRLVVDLNGRGSLSPEAWQSLPAPTRQAVALGLAEQTSAPDLAFFSRCPSCAALLEFELDPLDLLRKELRFGGERLVAEVHCLAWHYGWAEAEILALPRARRFAYLELVRRQVEVRPLVERWS
jgi:hypothetical protein